MSRLRPLTMTCASWMPSKVKPDPLGRAPRAAVERVALPLDAAVAERRTRARAGGRPPRCSPRSPARPGCTRSRPARPSGARGRSPCSSRRRAAGPRPPPSRTGRGRRVPRPGRAGSPPARRASANGPALMKRHTSASASYASTRREPQAARAAVGGGVQRLDVALEVERHQLDDPAGQRDRPRLRGERRAPLRARRRRAAARAPASPARRYPSDVARQPSPPRSNSSVAVRPPSPSSPWLTSARAVLPETVTLRTSRS